MLTKSFSGQVRARRDALNQLLSAVKCHSEVYPSRHFAERMVERNVEAIEVLFMLRPALKELRGSTYNDRTFLIKYKRLALVAKIAIIDGARYLLLKTIIDKYDEKDFDVCIQL
jgi:hypothetical protein